MNRQKTNARNSRLGSITPAEIIATSRLFRAFVFGVTHLRIRTIKPEFWTNEKLCLLSESTHILAAALLNYSDDEGYFNANPKLIEAAIFPLREPSRTVTVMLRELSEIDYLRLGKSNKDGRKYGFIVGFSEHQTVNKKKKSKIKPLDISWSDTGQIPEEYRTDTSRNREQGKEQGKEQGTWSNARVRATKTKTKTKTNDDFELFWKSYPKKIGKKDALKAFQKARRTGLPEIGVVVASIEKQRKSDQWKRDNGQYIPNPSTWLNQGRWDDEVVEPRATYRAPSQKKQVDLDDWARRKEQEIHDAGGDSKEFEMGFGLLPEEIRGDRDDA